MSTAKITFGKFERPAAGDDCNGCDVFINGVRTLRARITREVDWKQSMMGAHIGMTVSGYRVEVGDADEVVVQTLGEARGMVRKYLAAQPVDGHLGECFVAMFRAIRTYRTRWGTLVTDGE